MPPSARWWFHPPRTPPRGARDGRDRPADQLIVAPDAGQRTWIAEQLAVLRDFGVAPTSAALERCFAEQHAEWHGTPGRDPYEAEGAIAAIGVGWGQALVDELGLRWAIVHDRTGTDLAVVGDPGAVMLHPVGSIAKRWDDPEGTLERMGDWLIEQVRGRQARALA